MNFINKYLLLIETIRSEGYNGKRSTAIYF